MRPVTLDIRGAIYAGEEGGVEVGPGTCAVTATGAVLAQGADAVVMVENTERVGNAVRITRPVYPGENVSRRGEDIERGGDATRVRTLLRDGQTTVHPDTKLDELIPITASSDRPVAVVDTSKKLLGAVDRTSVMLALADKR